MTSPLETVRFHLIDLDRALVECWENRFNDCDSKPPSTHTSPFERSCARCGTTTRRVHLPSAFNRSRALVWGQATG